MLLMLFVKLETAKIFYVWAPVVRKLDSAIHWINHYPVDSAIGFLLSLLSLLIHWIVIYPVDSTVRLLYNWYQTDQSYLRNIPWGGGGKGGFVRKSQCESLVLSCYSGSFYPVDGNTCFLPYSKLRTHLRFRFVNKIHLSENCQMNLIV